MSVYSGYLESQNAYIRNKQLHHDDSQTGKDTQSSKGKPLYTTIQKKFLICILLVLLVAASISTAYFVLTKHDKQLESQQRIQVAFDMLIHDMKTKIHLFTTGIEKFLKDSRSIHGAAYMYANQWKSSSTNSVRFPNKPRNSNAVQIKS